MSFIHPRIRPQFESLPREVKNSIMKSNFKLYNYDDLEACINAFSEKRTNSPNTR